VIKITSPSFLGVIKMFSLLFYPDPRLFQKAEPVMCFDDALKQSVHTLFEVMRNAQGIGLSACHMGDMRRYLVLDLPAPDHEHMPLVCINPIIVSASQQRATFTEGSVSMPHMRESVERASHISLSYQDIEGQRHTLEAQGFLSACLQHEIDQLDGIIWIERLSRLKRERLIKKYKKS
jgi:peptide deformylase